MEDYKYILIVLGMGIVSFIPRWLPLFYLSRKQLPDLIVEWLGLIPVSILSALLFPALFTKNNPKIISLVSPETAAAIPTFIFAWITKSIGGTLIAGMFFYWAAGKFIFT
ncbi:MAG: AzlD domain-containing protein [Thermodesulfobacteriota bacterium]